MKSTPSPTARLPLSNSPVREEIVPIAGITLTIRDASIQRVWQEPEHVQLEIRKVEAPAGGARDWGDRAKAGPALDDCGGERVRFEMINYKL